LLQQRLLASVNGLWWVVTVSGGTLICGMAGLIATLLLRHS
jgi:hypothetical protein